MNRPFESLYGKPEPPLKPKVEIQDLKIEQPQVWQTSKIIDDLTRPFVSKVDLGEKLSGVFQELDRSKLFMLLMAVALVVLFVLVLFLSSKQQANKTTISSLQKRLKRIRNM